MTAYITLGFVGFVLVAWWVLGTLAERTADRRKTRRKTRDIQKSGREAARGRHPAGRHIPPFDEGRNHMEGKSVADAAADDHIRLHLEAMLAMPDARKEARP